MLQWSFFYSILNIPDTVEDPTIYQLLGIDPLKTLSPEDVDQVLNERKQLLRQHMPGPQFIPILLAFERELDAAAATLKNQDLRREYDKKLLRESDSADAQAIREKQEKIAKARHAITDALNEDGTLDNQQRLTLADELVKLGFNKSQTRQLLSRIPQAMEVSEKSLDSFRDEVFKAVADGVISLNDEKFLVELGSAFGLSESDIHSMINQALEGKLKPPAKPSSPVTPKTEPTPAPTSEDTNPPVASHDTSHFPAATDFAHIPTPLAPEQSALEPANTFSDIFFRIILPLSTVLIFTVSVYFYAKHHAPADSSPTTVITQPAPNQSGRADLPEPDEKLTPAATPPSVTRYVVTQRYFDEADDRLAATRMMRLLNPSTMPEPDTPQPETLPFKFTESVSDIYSNETPTPQKNPFGLPHQEKTDFTQGILISPAAQNAQGPVARAVRQLLSTDTDDTPAQLTNIATITVALADQVAQFTAAEKKPPVDLSTVKNKQNLLPAITGNLVYRPFAEKPAPASFEPQPMDDATRAQWQADLSSENPAIVYNAIARLAVVARTPGADNPIAADALNLLLQNLDELVPNATSESEIYLIQRYLHELTQISNPVIAPAMVDTLNKTRNKYLAHRITYLLRDHANSDLESPSPGLLPLNNTRLEQTQAVIFWRQQFKDNTFYWQAGSKTTDNNPDDTHWMPADQTLQLIACASLNTSYLADTLQQFSWTPVESIEQYLPDQPDQEDELNTEEKKLLEWLRRRVRSMLGKQLSVDTDPSLVAITDDTLATFNDSSSNQLWQIVRLILTTSQAQKLAMDVDMILYQHHTKYVAARTPFQQIAVNYETSSRLLQLLTFVSSTNPQAPELIDAIEQDRLAHAGIAQNVLEEIQNHAYRNLVLWEMLNNR